jgi:hypothetical protein
MKFICRSKRTSWLGLVLLSAFVTSARAQTEAVPSDSSGSPDSSVAQQLTTLAAALRATQQQVEQSRTQIKQMQDEIDRLRGQLGEHADLKPAAPFKSDTAADARPESDAEALERSAEELDMLKSTAAEQQQAKVESSSRLPVRLTGLILFNAFVNHGVVDQIDLPSSALLTTPHNSSTSTGATLRQTILGLEGTGPIVWGAHTSAHISMDFFGGVDGASYTGSAGSVRLRTAGIRAEWKQDILEVNYDTPIISPLSPESFATVAQPALAWSGNLWTWAPQLKWKHSLSLGDTGRQFSLELGLIDTQSLNGASYLTQLSAGPGEASGQPGYETRVSFHRWNDSSQSRGFEFGMGGFYGRQRYSGTQRVDTWATTADWQLRFNPRLRLSGELYRGRGIGSLGGGAYRDVVAFYFPGGHGTYLRPLDAEGGWLEWSYTLSNILRANASIGQDAGSGVELRNSIPLATTNPIYFYARNRSIVGNLVLRPWASFFISPEYRRLQSWPIEEYVNSANIFTLTFGYQF